MEPNCDLTADLIVCCPQCGDFVAIEKLNCRIFRHASYIANGEQIPPHTPQKECERLSREGLIFGCGKPFQIIVDENNQNKVIICGYI